jgi:hypothetical protein
MSEMSDAVARGLRTQVEEFLSTCVQAGIDPQDWVLEEGPLDSEYSYGVVTFTQTVRLRLRQFPMGFGEYLDAVGDASALLSHGEES